MLLFLYAQSFGAKVLDSELNYFFFPQVDKDHQWYQSFTKIDLSITLVVFLDHLDGLDRYNYLLLDQSFHIYIFPSSC